MKIKTDKEFDNHQPVEKEVVFLLTGCLNEHVRETRRNIYFTVKYNGSPSIRNMVHSLKIPHSEIGVVTVNDRNENLEYQLSGGEVVCLKPAINQHLEKIQNKKFVVDVNLGKLAGKLRLLGFDTLFENNFKDDEIVNLSESQKRIILTRDKGIMVRNKVLLGYWIRSSNPKKQLYEVISRLQLKDYIIPFSRCVSCNGLLEPANNDSLKKLDKETKQYYSEFWECSTCGQLYWKGTHYSRIVDLVEKLKNSDVL